jgi:hypothetical protein
VKTPASVPHPSAQFFFIVKTEISGKTTDEKLTGQNISLRTFLSIFFWACPFGPGYRAVSFRAR